MAGRRAAREGAAVARPGDPSGAVGVVTSGSFCPSLGSAAAQALVDRDVAAAGTPLEVLVRDAALSAVVTPLPFVRRGSRP